MFLSSWYDGCPLWLLSLIAQCPPFLSFSLLTPILPTPCIIFPCVEILMCFHFSDWTQSIHIKSKSFAKHGQLAIWLIEFPWINLNLFSFDPSLMTGCLCRIYSCQIYFARFLSCSATIIFPFLFQPFNALAIPPRFVSFWNLVGMSSMPLSKLLIKV